MSDQGIKGYIKKRFWRSFQVLRSIYVNTFGQLLSEIRIIKQLGFIQVIKELFGKRAVWKESLPVQQVLQYDFSFDGQQETNNLEELLKASKIPSSAGGHTLYLAPQALKNSPFAFLYNYYPSNAGLKIVKESGAVEQSHYISGSSGHSELQRKVSYKHKQLSLVANFLHLENLGPRLFDLIELKWQDLVWTAYVVEHLEDTPITEQQCLAGIKALKALEAQELIALTCPKGFDNMDFKPPNCNGNAFIEPSNNAFRYVDFQNFLLPNYQEYLEQIAKQSIQATHYGEKSLLRGGQYLYQSIPGLKLPAKRRIESRLDLFESMMDELSISFSKKIVLDIGCNIGMTMAAYLKNGATWCHGWDLPEVCTHSEKLLLALGATRFSLSGKHLNATSSLVDDLPAFLKNNLNNCIISYLAIHRHLGWIQALSEIPWSFMLYEGHEGESESDFKQFMEELNNIVPIQVAKQSVFADGECLPRHIAIIQKL